MIRKFLSDVSIQIPPRVQNQFFHPHWISQGLCHWNSQYTWFSKVSWVFRGTMVHGFSKDSFEFRSISFPRTLSYLIKLSSILFSQSVCLTQNVVLFVRLPVRLWAPICLYPMPHYALRCYTRTLIMVPINFWGDSYLFKKRTFFELKN